MTCEYCGKEDCEMGGEYVSDGDLCCCGGTIKNVGVVTAYENLYVCDQCGREWFYD